MGKIEVKNRILQLENRHYLNWQKLNGKFEEGFMYLRPTNRTIGELLDMSERQVCYYINSAKKELKRMTEGLKSIDRD